MAINLSTMTFKIPLWKHQREAIEIASRRSSYALFFEMGTGKTATAINILRTWSMEKGTLLNTLVLCPPIVIDQWADEFIAHSNIAPTSLVKLKGTNHKRLRLLQEGLESGRPKVYITNYETLSMSKIFERFLLAKFQVLICDESHKLKSIKAKRTKQATILADTIPRKLILTGSPILNSPMDIFAQFRIMDGGKTFGKNFFVFRPMYFWDGNAGMPRHRYFPDWKPRPDCHKEIGKLIYRSAMRVTKEQCLDLPPLVKQEIYVELSPGQKKSYKEMRDDLVTYLDGEAAVAQLALTKILRLQQIVSGFVNLDPGLDPLQLGEKIKKHRFDDVPRFKVLKELLEQLTPEHKVIIWACFHDNYRRIKDVCESLAIESVEIHGLKSAKEKTSAIESFRHDPACRVMVANQKAGGVGLNLTEASYSIYFSRGYSLEDDLQSEARNHRGGSERHTKITRIDLVAKDTIDALILTALKNKQNLANNILAMRSELKQC